MSYHNIKVVRYAASKNVGKRTTEQPKTVIHSKSSPLSIESTQGRFFTVTVFVFSARLRLRWCGFCQHLALTRLSACCLSRCCMHRFASLKQASDAFRFCPTVIPFHLSTVRRCLECDGASINLPRPQRARSASMCWVSTTADILVISAGSCCGLYCTLCFST